jgi:ketosteroid isomerase-like protein
MTHEANVAVVRRMVDAFNRDDVESVLAAFDNECEIDEPTEMPDSPVGGYHGHDGIRRWMANLRDVAGVAFEPRSVRTRNGLVVCELDSHGRGRTSGAPMTWITYAVFEMRDDRIARVRVFLDRAEALRSAGLPEEAGSG